MALLSAAMIVGNEEVFLSNCLQSIRNIVDEIVVVDTGSTDRTVSIAKQFDANVSVFPWKGDFAAAYVVGHEVAHHVQNELGILSQVNRARQSMSTTDSNHASVMVELQADCFAGIWARYSGDRLGALESGDIEEAMNAAKQIGDDTLQRNAGQRPNPHSFTHGTSEQRQRWFATGYEKATVQSCDTFSTDRL